MLGKPINDRRDAPNHLRILIKSSAYSDLVSSSRSLLGLRRAGWTTASCRLGFGATRPRLTVGRSLSLSTLALAASVVASVAPPIPSTAVLTARGDN